MRNLALAAMAFVALAACTPADDREANNDVKSTAANIGGAFKAAVNSPSGQALKEDVKDLAGDAGKALKKGAREVAEGAKDAKQMADEKVERDRRAAN